MRYTLYVSDKEWDAWHTKLGRFWNYFDKASKKSTEYDPRRNGFETPNLSFSSNLPSPPGSNHTSPPYATNHSFGHPALPHPLSFPPYLPPPMSSPVPLADSRFTTRKRSRDEDSFEPSAKRPALPSSSATATPSTVRGSNSTAPRLPMPNLTISTNPQTGGYNSSNTAHLPPPSKMASGPSSGASRWPQNTHLPTLPQPSPFGLPANGNLTGTSDWQTRQSPYGAGSATPSPTSFNFPQSQQHTPTHLSPSGYPPTRHSPYKPVRGVNTLLVPPPSASLHNPPEHLGYDQMHYQPLGKPVSERRTGTLPYVHHDPWTQPPHLQHVYLPQPTLSAGQQTGSQSRFR